MPSQKKYNPTILSPQETSQRKETTTEEKLQNPKKWFKERKTTDAVRQKKLHLTKKNTWFLFIPVLPHIEAAIAKHLPMTFSIS